MSAPNFASLSSIEERILAARLEAVRVAITHSGEKGRNLEFHVQQLLRDLLPAEYGLTTGFVAYVEKGTIKLTSQLDIIIYDAMRYGPLIHMEACDVLPIEAVYGYVEVKATLRSSSDENTESASDSIESLVVQNSLIRRLRTRVFNETMGGSPLEVEARPKAWLAPRAYVVAFEPVGVVANDADIFAKRLATVSRRCGGVHLHGVFVPGHAFYYTRPIDVRFANADDEYHVKCTTKDPLLAFKSILMQGLGTFPRPPIGCSPALDHYFKHAGQWKEQSPDV